MKPKNEKQFKQLIDKYESIQEYEIEDNDNCTESLNKLTGFGNSQTCTLCKDSKCHECVYIASTGKLCFQDINSESYYQIYRANTAEKLINAIRSRAKHMREVLAKLIKC